MNLVKLATLDGTVQEVTIAQAIYRCAAHSMDLDLAPAMRVVDSFVKRLFDCSVDELDAKQRHAVAVHIKNGDLKAHAGELVSQAWNDLAERKVTMAGTNGKMKLVDMTEDELLRLEERRRMGVFDDDKEVDLYAIRAKRNGHVKASSTAEPSIEVRPTEPEGSSASEVECGKLVEIDISMIVASPFNPRKHFDQGKLDELAVSLKHDGQLQNIVVRSHTLKTSKGHYYEIICGERRWRAGKIAGLPTMRCIVINVSTAKAIELAGMENYKRSDLNVIEEAIWFQEMISGAGYTQQRLADHLGISQGQVANRLRLLQLPEAWQKEVISGELTPTHARDVATWAEYPNVLAEIDKRIKDRAKHNPYFPNVKEFADIVRSSALHVGRPVKGNFGIRTEAGGTRSGVVLFKPTAQQREALRIEMVEDYNGKHEYAFNVELWEELQAQGKKEEKRRQQKKLDKAGPKPAAAKNDQHARAMAQQKAHQEAQQRERMRQSWLVHWLRQRILLRLDGLSEYDLYRLALCADFSAGRWETAIKSVGGTIVKSRGKWGIDFEILESLRSVHASKLPDFCKAVIRGWAEEVGSHEYFGQNEIDDTSKIAAFCGVDAKEWSPSKDCLELFTLDELKAIAKEWKFHAGMVQRAADREFMIELLLTPGAPRPMPTILFKLIPAEKPVKRKAGSDGDQTIPVA